MIRPQRFSHEGERREKREFGVRVSASRCQINFAVLNLEQKRQRQRGSEGLWQWG